MKKTLLASAVAATMAATSAQAAVTLFDDGTTSVSNYGRINFELQNIDGDNEIVDNGSRLGFALASQLDNGMTAIANIEMRGDLNNNGELSTPTNSFVGVQGDFGRVRFGSFDSVIYSNVTGVADIARGDGTGFGFLNGAGTNARGSQIAFDTADLGGMRFGVAIQHTEETATQDEEFNLQAYGSFTITDELFLNVGIDANNAERAALTFTSDDLPGGELELGSDKAIFSATLAYVGIQDLVLGAAFETGEFGGERLIHVGGLASYNYGAGNVYGLLSYLDYDSGEANGLQIMVGADYVMSQNFFVYAEVATSTDDIDTMKGDNYDNSRTNVALGARYHW